MSADPVRDVFRALRQSRPDADGGALLAEAERIVAERAKVAGQGQQPGSQSAGGDIGGLATTMHGIQSGLLMDFDDEVFGVINAVAPVTAGGTLAERYRQGRDAAREIKAGAQAARPVTYGAGQVAGSIAGGLAVAAPATAAKTVALGVGMGSAGALGGSGADLTRGEVGEAIADTAIGGVIGGVASAVPAVAKAGLARLRGAKGAASALGAKSARFADEPALLDIVKPAAAAADDAPSALRGSRAMTMREASDEARRLEGVVSDDIGEKFALQASQATGDPAAALGERVARQQEATIRGAQADTNARLRQYQQWLNVQVKRVAADPDAIGREDVSEAIEKGTDRFFKEATAARTAEAAPLFAAAEAAAGGKRIMTTERTVAALKGLVDDYSIGSSRSIGAALQKDLDDIVELGTGTGRLSAKDFQRLMSTWSKKLGGDVSISSDLGAREQKRIAGTVLDALRADLDGAADGIASGEAADSLKAARAAWAKHSQNIDDHATDTVNAILQRGQGDAATTAKWLMAKSPAQIRGVLRVLDSADPKAGAQFRAQFLEEMFTGAGKPGVNADLVDELALTQVSPAKLAKSIADNYERLQVTLGDNPAAIEALRDVASVTKRLAFGAGIEGSDTAPKLWFDGAKKAAEATAGSAGGTVVDAVSSIVGNTKALGAAFGTPDGSMAFRDAIAVTVGRKQVNAKVAGGIIAALTRAGLLAVQPSGEEQIEARRLSASRER
jgi:hypothetical protein